MTPFKILFLSGCLALLSACGSPQNTNVNKRAVGSENWPAMKAFPPKAAARSVYRSNRDIFEEFLDLTFSLESGDAIPRLTRFEGPITVAFARAPKPTVSQDLDYLLTRLRQEAGINISRISSPAGANIIIETLPRKKLQRAAPNAACIVVPQVRSWADFRKNRFNRRTDWTSLQKRQAAMIFMPSDVSAQDSRDCLHEELAQALGPLNDLYRLPDSVYNDDNFHIVLSAYDMMILRVFYAPEIHNGMEQHQVASVLPRILARLNPVGNSISPRNLQETRRDWIDAIETALGSNVSSKSRLKFAQKAVRIATEAGYTDHRLGFSFFARARVSMSNNAEQAAADFARAYANFNQEFGPYDIHTAQAALQMASLSISANQLETAMTFIEQSLIGAKTFQNARLMFSLLAMKAEILKLQGQPSKAAAIRSEAVSYGRYGIVSAKQITDRLLTISHLKPGPKGTHES